MKKLALLLALVLLITLPGCSKAAEAGAALKELVDTIKGTQPADQTEPAEQIPTALETEPPTEPVTEAPTEPVTEAPTESDAPVPAYPEFTEEVSLANQDQRYRINLFLSNFAEQEFNEGDWYNNRAITTAFQRDTAPAWQYVDFMFTWYNINASNRAEYSSDYGYMYLTRDQINEKMIRYFGRTLSQAEFESSGYEISGDRLAHRWGIGESHGNLAIAEQMWGNGQGQYLVRFHIMTWDEMNTGGNIVSDKSVYNLDYETACGKDWLLDYRDGYAIVEGYHTESVDSYNLIAYWLDGQTGP